jgi:O-antigen ligase
MPDLHDSIYRWRRLDTSLRWQVALPGPPFKGRGRSTPSARLDSPQSVVERSLLNRSALVLFSLFVFAIPWENAVIFPGAFTVSHLLGLVSLPLAVLAILESGRLKSLSLPVVLIGLFMAWGSLSYFWTVDVDATTVLVASWIQNLGMVCLILELADSRAGQIVMMRAYVLGTLVSAGDTIQTYLKGKETFYQRYAGSGFDPNDLGLLLALSLPLSLYLSVTERRRALIWVYRIQFVVAVLAIGLTGSRAALVATFVALLYVPLALARATFRKRFALLLVTAIVISSAVAFVPATSWKRWGGTGKELAEGTLGARRIIWSAGLELFHMSPIAGIGAGGFAAGTERILGQAEVAHNTFLSVLVEEGVIGLVLLLAVLLSLVLPALRLPRLERDLWLVLMATWAVGVSSLTWENRKPTWLLFGLLAGWLSTSISVGRGIPHKFTPVVKYVADLRFL